MLCIQRNLGHGLGLGFEGRKGAWACSSVGVVCDLCVSGGNGILLE